MLTQGYLGVSSRMPEDTLEDNSRIPRGILENALEDNLEDTSGYPRGYLEDASGGISFREAVGDNLEDTSGHPRGYHEASLSYPRWYPRVSSRIPQGILELTSRVSSMIPRGILEDQT